MELDLIRILKEAGINGTIGIAVVLMMKYYVQKIIDQNSEFMNYLMKANEQLLETNTKIQTESTKALEEHGKLIKTLTDEIRRKNNG